MRTGLKALKRPEGLEVALIGARRPVCQFVEGL
jgi:hypothetical protein